VLVLSSLLFYLGSKYYAKDMDSVTKVELEVR